MALLAVFVTLLFAYSLVSRRLESSVITAPIVFTTAGMLTLLVMPGLREQSGGREIFLVAAEVGLVLLLFTDASHADLHLLRSIRWIPTRLLSTGLLLTIVLGALCALVVFRQLTLWEAGILGAILAPTDAGLGQVIVNSPRVPAPIRQALSVEAGLNDGLSVPFLLFFLAMAAPQGDSHSSLVLFIVEQLGYGAAVGIGIGLVGGLLLGLARRRGWLAESFEPVAAVMLPFACILASEAVGASMLIAAFVAGLAVQVGFKDEEKHDVRLAEEWGQILNLSVFFVFGLLVARDLAHFDLSLVLYAVLSLTVVRMLPVAVALRGTGLSSATVWFMGWFGPRGLASIVLGLVYLEHVGAVPTQPIIHLAVMTTVLLSIFAHGMTAKPGIELYTRRLALLGPDAPERRAPGNVG